MWQPENFAFDSYHKIVISISKINGVDKNLENNFYITFKNLTNTC